MESGFTVHADRRLGTSPYSPAADWNGKFENEWVLDYTRWDSSTQICSGGQSLTISMDSVSTLPAFYNKLDFNSTVHLPGLGMALLLHAPQHVVCMQEGLREHLHSTLLASDSLWAHVCACPGA